MQKVTVPIHVMPGFKDLGLPRYATPLSSGVNLIAAIAETMPLQPRERVLVPTGITIGLLPGWEAQIRVIPELVETYGVFVLGAPITIDADYRGELKVPLYNTSQKMYMIRRGQKIAQLVVSPVARIEWQEVSGA